MSVLEKRFVLQVPSSTQNLAMVRQFANSVGEQAGMEDSDVAKLQLAIDEACANVIEHAYGHDSTKEVMVRATFDSKSIRFDIIDTGARFDPSEVVSADPQELIAARRKGGLGLTLIRTLMDEVHYEYEAGEKNQLTMVKYLSNSSTTDSEES